MNQIFLGVLSGTSMDAIDVAAYSFLDNVPKYLGGLSNKLPVEYKQKYQAIIDAKIVDIVALGELDHWTGDLFATAILSFLKHQKIPSSDVSAIGSHGQTLWHAPNNKIPFTIQLGDPNIIAVKTGITTVADFRRADIAAGGQGAPLAPAFHNAAFKHETEARCIINIGGISNISILENSNVIGFDIGPGNLLLDAWTHMHFKQDFDRDGIIASGGSLIPNLLNECLQDPYFKIAPPKSSGKEDFNLAWLQQKLNATNSNSASPQDILTTLTHLTAISIAETVKKHAPKSAVYLCGGGALNAFLRNIIQQSLGYTVATTTDLGIEPQWVEAALFAWLAQQRVTNQKLDLNRITGANVPLSLGAIYQP
jgi:anhydro-N-acetylmuramic acid kinase